MKLEVKLSLSFERKRKEEAEEQFEHRDTESYVEPAGPQRVGFDIPLTTEDRRH